jgi:hypothetical protein
MLLFGNHTFVSGEGGTISLVERNGFKIQDILPQGFEIEGEEVHVAPPFDRALLSYKKIQKDMKELFKDAHFNALNTLFFGERKAKTTAFDKNLCHKALHELLPKEDTAATKDNTFSMKLARQQYTTNFKTMWSNKRKAVNLLNKLLETLLRQHLAPQREEARKQFIKQKKEEREKRSNKPQRQYESLSIPLLDIRLINKTRNGKKRLFKNEQKRREAYLKKADALQGKIQTLEQEQMDVDFEPAFDIDWDNIYQTYENSEDRDAIINELQQDAVMALLDQPEHQQDQGDLLLETMREKERMLRKRADRCETRLDTYVQVLEREVGGLFY